MPVIILGLLHAYIGLRLLPDLAASPGVRFGGALLLLVSGALMLAGLRSRSIQSRVLADKVAAVGLFAMSLFSSVFVFTLLRDIVLLVAIVSLPVRYVHTLQATTAFLVVNAASLGAGRFSIGVWLAPTVVGVPVIAIWTAYYRKRFASPHHVVTEADDAVIVRRRSTQPSQS